MCGDSKMKIVSREQCHEVAFANYSARNQTWDLLSGDSAVPNAGDRIT